MTPPADTVFRGRHYATGEPIQLTVRGGLIHTIERDMTADGPYLAPAFFDLQVNGALGHDFSSSALTLERIRAVVEACRGHGIGSFLPTLITNGFESLAHGLRTIRQAVESDRDLALAMPGVHLEGPYLSPEDGPRGAHPRQHIRPPNREEFRRLQEAAGGRIRLVTLAPEQEGAIPFVEWLTRQGVIVAIGHTAATGDQIRDAVRAGACLSTHLGNGCHAMLHRHRNPIWEQLGTDELWASIICDGHHLPEPVVRTIFRVKGTGRLVLTCDASSLAGLPPGTYREWGQELEIQPEGKIQVKGTGFLAGSWAFTDTCVAGCMRMAGATLAEAVDMAGARPRELLGLPPLGLEPGMPADLVLLDQSAATGWSVRGTLVGGRWFAPRAAVQYSS